MRNSIVKIPKLVLLLLFAVTYGCEDGLQEVVYSDLTPNNFYQNEGDAQVAVAGIYSRMNAERIYAFSVLTMTSMPSKYTVSRVSTRQYFSAFTFDNSNSELYDLWSRVYETVAAANAVLDNVPEIDMDESKKNVLLGEAHFLRALNYFDAVRLWGDVPLVLNEVTSLDGINVSRDPVSEVYKVIIDDLKFAEEWLPESRSSSEAGRATSGAAKTLLGKVYLTMAGQPVNDDSKWEMARDKLKEVIDSGTYGLLSNYEDVFQLGNELNNELIFVVQQSEAASQGTSLSYVSLPPLFPTGIGNGSYRFGLTTEFYNQYESQDSRRNISTLYTYVTIDGDTVTYNDDTDRVNTYQDPRGISTGKYIDPDTRCCNGDNDIPLFRYADVLLMFSEAENEVNGPTSEAFQYLNTVRERAGATLYNSSTDHDGNAWTKESLREAIHKERYLELSFEFQEVFWIRRWGKVEETIQESPEANMFGISYDSKFELYPIPLTAMDANPNLTQNTGW